MEDSTYTNIDRKQFLKTAGSTALFAFLGIGLHACSDNPTGNNPPPPAPGDSNAIQITNNGNTVTINLGVASVSSLRSAGGWTLVGAARVLVVNVDGTTIRAFTSVCTHQGCADNWQFANSQFECTCHGSRFGTNGAVVRGPATRDLAEFSVTRNGDIVTINK
jgi:cytochrome b6-f complex iron-sulfur subunit